MILCRMPLVSVIMNVRNGADTLREALDSVLAQTFTDWEVIVWDDCSTDDSAAVVAQYTDERIKYFLSPVDTPLGPARELAIQQARGEWLSFLDQDDVWQPDKLRLQLALIAETPEVALVYGRTVAFTEAGWERDYDHRHEFKPLPEGDIFAQLFIDSCFISMSSVLLRRAAYEEIGGIPKEILVISDYYLFAAIARRYPARAVQKVVCRYRLHAANMSRHVRARMHQEAIWLIDQCAAQLDPLIVVRRRRVHYTVLSLEEMLRARTFARGLTRLLTQGSLWFLFSRPFAIAFRTLRRYVQRPYFIQGC